MNFKKYYSFIYSLLVMVVAGALFYMAKPYLPSKLFVTTVQNNGVTMDTYMLQATRQADSLNLKREKDSLIKAMALQNNSEQRFIDLNGFQHNDTLQDYYTLNNLLPGALPLTSYIGENCLTSFFSKLMRMEQGSNEVLRIAYYGDSMNDGDLIVQDLRTMFQERFGGQGVGFVPIYSQSEGSRITVKVSQSNNWVKRDFLSGNASTVGVSGDLFYAGDSLATVTYRSGYVKYCNTLPKPILYYGKGNDSAKVGIVQNGRQDSTLLQLKGDRILNTLPLSEASLQKLELRFRNAQEVPVYGVAFASNTGVIIDTYSKRGNSGLPLAAMSRARLQAFNETLRYDLVIMQFGANVLTTKRKNYDWYAQKMIAVTETFKTSFPDAEILFLGTADRGTKQGTEISTDPGVVALAAAQQYAAWQSKSGFISLLHLMGGTNTMTTWNNHKPKLANDDFTHFSPQGSKEIATRIFNELMNRLQKLKNEKEGD